MMLGGEVMGKLDCKEHQAIVSVSEGTGLSKLRSWPFCDVIFRDK